MKNATRMAILVGTLGVFAALALSATAVLAQNDRTCSACGQPIHGPYFETGGHFYHSGCFTCEYCKKPIEGPFTVFRGKNYHTPCFEAHVALRCAVCDGIIQGQYLLDYWGNAYHTHHKGVVLQCDFCQRFIVGALADGMRRLPDGRALCAKCAPNSVTSIREARSIIADVAKMLRSYGIEVDPGPIELRVVGQDELARIAGGHSHEAKGFTDYLVKKGPFGKVTPQSVKVYLLYGTPRTQTTSTVAHELMHIWQFQNGRLDQDPALSEGSCNFASYLVLRRLGGSEAEFVIDGMLKDPDVIYGEGFRRVKSYVEEKGISAWLRLLKEKNPDLTRR